MRRNKKATIKIPWDSEIFGIPTYEIIHLSEKSLRQTTRLRGHFTARIEPLSPQRVLLYRYGFYYCGTLIQPYCTKKTFRYFTLKDGRVEVNKDVPLKDLLAISHGAFNDGRFQRDFNIGREAADKRYDVWLRKLYKSKNVFGLLYNGRCIGFFGFRGHRIRLHAICKEYRGKGLAKYLWSAACKELFDRGHQELVSSISVANTAAVNLYVSLGFKFRNPLDVYHKVNI